MRELTPMKPTLEDFIFAVAYGRISFSRNAFWDFGWDVFFINGRWNFTMYCGPFGIEAS